MSPYSITTRALLRSAAKNDLITPSTVINRRIFLADVGLGFTGLALGAMLAQDGVARAETPQVWQPPH